jgi:transposase-like protein
MALEDMERTAKTWTPSRRKRWSEREGRSMLEALARSGQTVAQFARRHELQEQRVRAWTKRFPEVTPASSAFMPVRVRAKTEGVMTKPPGVEVRLRGGHAVRVGLDFDAELLRRVVAALEEGGEPC